MAKKTISETNKFETYDNKGLIELFNMTNTLIEKYDNEARANENIYKDNYLEAKQLSIKYLQFKQDLINEYEKRINALC